MTAAPRHVDPGAPAAWLRAHAHLIRTDALVLDVACGRGRHALFLARLGHRVHAVDRDADAVASLRAAAAAEPLPIRCDVLDLEMNPPPALGDTQYDAVVVFNYLHRPLVPVLLGALAPGGVLIYETFTRAQAARGRPTNPAFLLEPGELRRLVAPLGVLDAREGEFEGRWVASIVAERER